MDIRYKIQFFTYWHCGSGLSRGADTDSLVVKDICELPFVPGKTVKGLMREATEDYIFLSGQKTMDALFKQLFGETGSRSEVHFSNATLNEQERNWIVDKNAQKHLYCNIASTAINKDGTAKEHSLRNIEVTVPCSLYGQIVNAPEGADALLEKSLGMIKNLGANRNHGLGRCSVKLEKGGDE